MKNAEKLMNLALTMRWGTDSEKGVKLTKDTMTFYHGDREVNVPVFNIDYSGKDFVFDKRVFAGDDESAAVVNTRTTIAMFSRGKMRDLLKTMFNNPTLSKCIKKKGDLWILQEKYLPLYCLFIKDSDEEVQGNQ
jgi:hypothetical protein